jgi:hypothetical protein
VLREALAAVAAVLLTILMTGSSPVLAGDAGQPGELPEPVASPEEVRQQADDVLDGREFQRPEPNLVQRAEEWLRERFNDFLNELVVGDAGSVVGWAVLALAVGLLVFFVVRLGRSVQRDPRTETAIEVERARTAAEWREDAEDHERRGAWKDALRSRFRALVADLVDLHRVDDLPGRTAGEYRAEVASEVPDAADAFAAATGLFEEAWYGNRATGPDENARFRALADEVVDRARRSARTEDDLVGAAP